MSTVRENGHNGIDVQALEVLLHALAHEVESQAYLQVAVRLVDDPEIRAILIDLLGQDQLHETRLRAKLREKYSLDV